MRVLSITHERDAGPGVFADAIAAAGGELEQWFHAETDSPPADPSTYDAVMAFGGSMHVDQGDVHPWIGEETALLTELLERGTPLLGVCLGAQLLSAAAGGEPRRARETEIGWYDVEVSDPGAADALIGPLTPSFQAFEWHSYECGPPAHATVLASTPVCAQAFRVGEAAWGIQFHAEVTRADLEGWIDDYRDGHDTPPGGLDPEELRARTGPLMPAWNQLGRALCDRFLAAAARSRAGMAG
jgi:GMP synthase-like glutamine amidotransferase